MWFKPYKEISWKTNKSFGKHNFVWPVRPVLGESSESRGARRDYSRGGGRKSRAWRPWPSRVIVRIILLSFVLRPSVSPGFSPPPADSILFYVFFHNSARSVERCTHCPDERLKTFRYAYICRPSPSFSPMRGAVENKNTTVKRLGENIIGRVRRTPVPRLSRVSMLPPSVKTSRLRRGRSFVAHTPAVRFTLLRVSARPFTGRTTIATGKVG